MGGERRAHTSMSRARAGDDQIMGIVPDRRAERPVVRQSKTAHQSEPQPARRAVPLDARDQEHIALRVKRPAPLRDPHAASRPPRDNLIGNDFNHRAGLARERQLEGRLIQWRQMDRVLHRQLGRRADTTALAFPRDFASVLDHGAYVEIDQVIDQGNISAVTGRDRAAVGKSIMAGRHVGCVPHRDGRCDASGNQPAQES